jgi:hypothetical protein
MSKNNKSIHIKLIVNPGAGNHADAERCKQPGIRINFPDCGKKSSR